MLKLIASLRGKTLSQLFGIYISIHYIEHSDNFSCLCFCVPEFCFVQNKEDEQQRLSGSVCKVLHLHRIPVCNFVTVMSTKCQSQAWTPPFTSEGGLHSQASFDM